jgi:hypothetical protein
VFLGTHSIERAKKIVFTVFRCLSYCRDVLASNCSHITIDCKKLISNEAQAVMLIQLIATLLAASSFALTASSMPFPTDKVLCILYSKGGIADVGRHSVRAALDATSSVVIRVLTEDPKTLLEETNWNCGCDSHTFSEEELKRLDIRTVDITKDDLQPHLDNVGGVISALGNRQLYYGHNVGTQGTQNLVNAMEARKIPRLVAITSVGLSEDWPPLEFHWLGGILKWMFVISRCHVDLQGVENTIKSSTSLDYLLIRPVGLSEGRRPKGEWFVQKKKGESKVGPDMSKMDCARFAVSEVMDPTYNRRGVVVGSNWETFTLDESKAEL